MCRLIFYGIFGVYFHSFISKSAAVEQLRTILRTPGPHLPGVFAFTAKPLRGPLPAQRYGLLAEPGSRSSTQEILLRSTSGHLSFSWPLLVASKLIGERLRGALKTSARPRSW